MKKIKWAIAALLILVSIYVVAGPFLTIYQINTGMVENDSNRLANNIEFSTLRHNMKDQLNVIARNNAADSIKKNPLLALGSLFAKTVVDQLVDSIVTPNGLASILEASPDNSMTNESINEELGSETVDKNSPRRKNVDYFRNAHYAYQSLNQFSVWVPNRHGEETQFILKREALSWKLVNIVIPLNVLAQKGIKNIF